MSDVYLRTGSGKRIDLIDFDLNEYDINDIADSLSKQWRWAGHLKEFYSVAQHCVTVANLVPNPELKLQALLHDAAEAYILDVPRPIKRVVPEYVALENNLMQSISKQFGFIWPMNSIVVAADDIILLTENRDLRYKPEGMDHENFRGIKPLEGVTLKGVPTSLAYGMFLDTFYDIQERAAA